MKQLLSLLFVITISVFAMQAQTKQYGKIKLNQETSITALLAESEQDLSGYRIHVFTGNANERQKAQNIASFVESTFAINAYVDWEPPLFKVRVGDFTDKFEAVSMKHKLKKYYKNAYHIKVKSINL